MRGNIYFVKMPEYTTTSHHSCEMGYRPIVVVSNDRGNNTNDIVMACPITTRIKHISCNVDVGWSLDGRPSQVLCNQIVTLPRSELRYQRGYLTRDEMRRVNIAMCIALDIKTNFEEVR